jgi:hypothetical protein
MRGGIRWLLCRGCEDMRRLSRFGDHRRCDWTVVKEGAACYTVRSSFASSPGASWAH